MAVPPITHGMNRGKFRDRKRAKRQPAHNKHCSSGRATMVSAQFQKSCATLREGDATVFRYRAENLRNRHGFMPEVPEGFVQNLTEPAHDVLFWKA